MKIHIEIGETKMVPVHDSEDVWYVPETNYINYNYYDSIDNAIAGLKRLQAEVEAPIQPRCEKCVYLKETCGQTDKDGKCWKYKRDPPDGGYYG